MKAHIDTITDLLLGAAYADKRLEGDELKSISAMLCKLLGTDALPAAQSERIQGFNPATFDVKAAAGRLRFESAENKRKVLELIASISESESPSGYRYDTRSRARTTSPTPPAGSLVGGASARTFESSQ